MSPSPTPAHQSVLRECGAAFHKRFKGKPCSYFFAPMDVRLSDDNVVQPDLMVICRSEQIKRTHIEGAPALIVEIISPSSAVHDRQRKMRLYARTGVNEYWLIQPDIRLVEVYKLAQGSYVVHGIFGESDICASALFPALKIPVKKLFPFADNDVDQELKVLRERQPPYKARKHDHAGSRN